MPNQPTEPLGMMRGTVELRAWDPRWPSVFDALADELRATLGDRVLDILHVGSTSVPGLVAKPILDVLVTVPDLPASFSLVPDLARMGFELGPGDDLPDRHYFRRGHGRIRTHHLSLTEPGSQCYLNQTIFRNALRGSDELAARYAELKLGLSKRHRSDHLAYLNGKTEFVIGVLRERDGLVADPDYPRHNLGHSSKKAPG